MESIAARSCSPGFPMCCALPSVFLNWLSALYTQNHEHLQSGGISQTALCMPQAGGSCKMLQDSMGMPSVERFEDADFQSLARRNLESAAECAICLANVEVGEDWVVLCQQGDVQHWH